MTDIDPGTAGAEIERLVHELNAIEHAPARRQAQDLVRMLLSLYGAALSRALAIVRTEQGGPDAVIDRFASEPLLASLLVLHDLHPHPIEVRIDRALNALHARLPSVSRLVLARVDGDAVRVRVEQVPAAASEPPGSSRLLIERAIQEAAPEVSSIVIEGLDDGLIQILRPSAGRPRESAHD